MKRSSDFTRKRSGNQNKVSSASLLTAILKIELFLSQTITTSFMYLSPEPDIKFSFWFLHTYTSNV